MLESAAAYATVIGATLATLAACAVLQYECLVLVWRWLSVHGGHRRVKVFYSIVSITLLHVAQIWIFGTMIFALLLWPACGSIAGPQSAGFLDCLYLSAVSFSTVGFGDVAPVGAIRFFVATEALGGLILIAWSASFTYIEMEKFWRAEDMKRR